MKKKKKEEKRVKRWKTLQTRLGVSGTDFHPTRSSLLLLFFTPHPTRVLDNRSPLVLHVRPSAQFAFLSGSSAMDDLLDSSIYESRQRLNHETAPTKKKLLVEENEESKHEYIHTKARDTESMPARKN